MIIPNVADAELIFPRIKDIRQIYVFSLYNKGWRTEQIQS